MSRMMEIKIKRATGINGIDGKFIVINTDNIIAITSNATKITKGTQYTDAYFPRIFDDEETMDYGKELTLHMVGGITFVLEGAYALEFVAKAGLNLRTWSPGAR